MWSQCWKFCWVSFSLSQTISQTLWEVIKKKHISIQKSVAALVIREGLRKACIVVFQKYTCPLLSTFFWQNLLLVDGEILELFFTLNWTQVGVKPALSNRNWRLKPISHHSMLFFNMVWWSIWRWKLQHCSSSIQNKGRLTLVISFPGCFSDSPRAPTAFETSTTHHFPIQNKQIKWKRHNRKSLSSLSGLAS